MARPLRIEYAGALYHVMARGNQGHLISGRKRPKRCPKKALKHLGVSQWELQESPKGAPEKTALAWWLRKRTSVSLLWVSQTLGMRHYTRVSKAVSWVEQKPARKLRELKNWLLELEKRDV